MHFLSSHWTCTGTPVDGRGPYFFFVRSDTFSFTEHIYVGMREGACYISIYIFRRR